MYPKRKTYKTYRKTYAPKTYRNGYVKTSKTITAYLNGYKLIMTRFESVNEDNTFIYFNVTKNNKIVGKVKATYWNQVKNLVLSWKSAQYVLTPFKK